MRQSSIDVESSAKVKTYVFPDSSTFTSLQERSPARLGEVLTVLAHRHAGVFLLLSEVPSRNSVAGSPTLEESNLRQKGDDPRTDQRKGVHSYLPGWHPKETASKLPSRARLLESTPLRVAQKPWCGHPRCGRPADYLPSGTVSQWPPATLQWRTEQKGGNPKTGHPTKETTRTAGWHPEEKEAQLPLVSKRYSRTSVCIALRRGPPRTPARDGEGTLASRRHWLLQVVAAPATTTRVDGRTRRPVRHLRLTHRQADRGVDGLSCVFRRRSMRM